MTLGDRLIVPIDREGRETGGVVIDIQPGRVDILTDDGEVWTVPYRHEDFTRLRYPSRVLP